jgi:hypothetical protein
MFARTTFVGWIISHRCSWITVYVFCRNAQSESHSDPCDICMLSLLYQLPNYNLFTQHIVIYLMERHHYWTVDPGPNSFTLLLPFTLLALFIFPHTITFYHSIRSILCNLQQTCEIDNLIVSWGKVLGCVVCRFHIAAGANESPGRGAL